MEIELFIFIAIVFGVIVVVSSVAIAVSIAKRFSQKKTQNEYAERYWEKQSVSQSATTSGRVGLTDEQRRRLDYLRSQQAQRTASDANAKHELHVQDAHEHAHLGEEEHYEEIVGSLGDVNDEGCEDLSGVRFIVHDLAYDTSTDGEHDYTELAKAMVLGEVVNSPRFKHPYSRK